MLTSISYQYDPFDNWLTVTKNGTTTTYKYDSANQISSMNGTASIYQYDRNGNQIQFIAPPVGLAVGLTYSVFSGFTGYSVGEEIWR